jgi:hypothetical protein
VEEHRDKEILSLDKPECPQLKAENQEISYSKIFPSKYWQWKFQQIDFKKIIKTSVEKE